MAKAVFKCSRSKLRTVISKTVTTVTVHSAGLKQAKPPNSGSALLKFGGEVPLMHEVKCGAGTANLLLSTL